MQFYDDQAYCYQQDENGNDYLPICRPWKFKMVDAAQGHTTNLAMCFADDYIENGLLAKDRKLLMLRCAVGGTGFCTGMLSNNQKIGNGDTIHFCVDASFTMGHQYFLNYLQIV